MITGFYLLDDTTKNLNFIVKRIRKLLPHFIMSILLFAAVDDRSWSLLDILMNFCGLQLIHLDIYINGILWFVVAEIPSVILFRYLYVIKIKPKEKSDKNSLMKTRSGLLSYIIPFGISVSILIYIGFMFQSFDLVAVHFNDFYYMAYVRAFCYISIGIYLRYVSNHIRCSNNIHKHPSLLKLIVALLTMLAVILQFYYAHTRIEFVVISVLGIAILNSQLIKWNHGFDYFISWISKYTYPIYAYQMAAIKQIELTCGTGKFSNLLYLLLISFGMGIIMDFIVNKLFLDRSRRRAKIDENTCA